MQPLILKFGSSVLANAQALPSVADEIARAAAGGAGVVAVVSAFAGVTDALIRQAESVGGAVDPYAYAALVGSGELESASMLALTLAAAGRPARLLTPEQFTLRARGNPLDAEPHDFDREQLNRALDDPRIAIVPGFIAHDERNRTLLLGRGGSDYTALFLAARLGGRCRLVKDVDGLYERDPAEPGPPPRRYRAVDWSEALRVAGKLVQPKTIRFAESLALPFEVGCIGGEDGTLIGPGPAAFYPAAA